MRLDRRALIAGLSAALLAPPLARAKAVTDAAGRCWCPTRSSACSRPGRRPRLSVARGCEIAEGAIGAVLSRVQLEALYGAPVEIVTDTAAGKSAFLPG